ncbi:Rho-type gtpase-activating protein [Coemansia sp. RSA 2049]|nr:Rho-type gtpase-activating protein [Coemansia sp. RSA 2049]
MSRQPSLRRQRQTRKHNQQSLEATANDHNNDSGSDAEDAIITTVPQKATKRFIWPFGGGGGGSHNNDSSHHSHSHGGASGAAASNSNTTGGGGGSGSGKNSEDQSANTGASLLPSSQHSFHVASTFRAGKCDHCQERFKTFTNSVVRCRTCGFVCHQKCVSEITASCNAGSFGQHDHHQHQQQAAGGNSNKAGGAGGNGADGAAVFDPMVPFQAHKMFGRDLVEQASIEGRSVPWVVRAAVAFIEAEGISMEGVYRRSGSTMDIREVQMQISKISQLTNQKFDISADGDQQQQQQYRISEPDMDVASVTSVLKQYFRDLPNPLMTSATYNLWVQAANVNPPEERVKVYRTIADSMPRAHSETLRFMMTHLKRIADNQKENKMTTNNLSVVFAPNILHMGKGDMLLEMANMSNINKTVSFVIQRAGEIWGDSHQDPDQRYGEADVDASAANGGGGEDKDGDGGSGDANGAAEHAPAGGNTGGLLGGPKLLSPLPFMLPPMRRQRGGLGGSSAGGGRLSDASDRSFLATTEAAASGTGVISSPSSPVHKKQQQQSQNQYSASKGKRPEALSRGDFDDEDDDDYDEDIETSRSNDNNDDDYDGDDGGGMAFLSQSMPSPKGLFFNIGNQQQQQQMMPPSGANARGGGGGLVYSQQHTGFASSNAPVPGGNGNMVVMHPRGSFDIPRK